MFGEPEEPDGDGSAPNGEDERVRVDNRDAALVVIAATAGGCGKPAVQFFLDIFTKFQQNLNFYLTSADVLPVLLALSSPEQCPHSLPSPALERSRCADEPRLRTRSFRLGQNLTTSHLESVGPGKRGPLQDPEGRAGLAEFVPPRRWSQV